LRTVTCPHCNEQVPTRKFCVSCGKPLVITKQVGRLASEETGHFGVRRPRTLILFTIIALVIATTPALIGYLGGSHSSVSVPQQYGTPLTLTAYQPPASTTYPSTTPFDFDIVWIVGSGEVAGSTQVYWCSNNPRTALEEPIDMRVRLLNGSPQPVTLTYDPLYPPGIVSVSLSVDSATPPFDFTVTIHLTEYSGWPYGAHFLRLIGQGGGVTHIFFLQYTFEADCGGRV
jgi:hypothetical protein